jgi:hypothetical protein
MTSEGEGEVLGGSREVWYWQQWWLIVDIAIVEENEMPIDITCYNSS